MISEDGNKRSIFWCPELWGKHLAYLCSGICEKTALTTPTPPCLYDIHREVIKIVYLAGLWSSHEIQIP